MKQPENYKGATIELELDVVALVERFKMGKVGIAYEKIMNDEEIQKYFENRLLIPCQKKYEAMDEKLKELLAITFSTENLWANFSINFVNNVFRNSIPIWLQTGGNLDDIIIGFADKDVAKKVIDIVADTVDKMAENMLRIRASNVDSSSNFEIETLMQSENEEPEENTSKTNVKDFYKKKSSKKYLN